MARTPWWYRHSTREQPRVTETVTFHVDTVAPGAELDSPNEAAASRPPGRGGLARRDLTTSVVATSTASMEGMVLAFDGTSFNLPPSVRAANKVDVLAFEPAREHHPEKPELHRGHGISGQ